MYITCCYDATIMHCDFKRSAHLKRRFFKLLLVLLPSYIISPSRLEKRRLFYLFIHSTEQSLELIGNCPILKMTNL